jgi:Sporulation and spore germination/Immunoglobulin-like domain of bacterial spore germination
VYYLSVYRTRPMLYREFHRLNIGDGSEAARTGAAVTEMLDGRTAYDSDYLSAWPASAKVRGVTVSGSVVTVDLSGAAVNGYDELSERAALQQLIWTATAASDTDGMRLLLDGQPVAKLWNLLDTRGTLRRAAAVEVVGPVWVIDPQQGAIVGKDGVTINVAGIVFEATMRVRVLDSSDKVVFDKTLTLSAGPPSQGTGSVRTPPLAPGRYKVEGFFISVADSSIQAMDDHTFTVR